MVEVYFDYGSTLELVATFIDEDLYNSCIPLLKIAANKAKAELVESLTNEKLEE